MPFAAGCVLYQGDGWRQSVSSCNTFRCIIENHHAVFFAEQCHSFNQLYMMCPFMQSGKNRFRCARKRGGRFFAAYGLNVTERREGAYSR